MAGLIKFLITILSQHNLKLSQTVLISELRTLSQSQKLFLRQQHVVQPASCASGQKYQFNRKKWNKMIFCYNTFFGIIEIAIGLLNRWTYHTDNCSVMCRWRGSPTWSCPTTASWTSPPSPSSASSPTTSSPPLSSVGRNLSALNAW